MVVHALWENLLICSGVNWGVSGGRVGGAGPTCYRCGFPYYGMTCCSMRSVHHCSLVVSVAKVSQRFAILTQKSGWFDKTMAYN